MNDVLVVIDMQNDFITGSLGSKRAQEIVPRVANKIKAYRYAGNPVIFTRDTHYESLYFKSHEGKHLPVEHCIYGTDGWEIPDEIIREAPKTSPHIVKGTFGRVYWDIIPPETKSIEIVGLCTDICVVSNALILRAQFPEADIKVDASCCAGTSEERHEAALLVMESCHIDVDRSRA